MSDRRVRKEAVARYMKKWQTCPKTAEVTLKASDPGEGRVAGTLWIDLHGNSMKGGCLEDSLKTLYSGDWVLGARFSRELCGWGWGFFSLRPSFPLFLLLLYLLFFLFFPILCSSIPILSLLSRHSVIQLRLTLTPSEAKNDHARLIFLPLPPDCWDHSHKPQHPAYVTLGISSRPRLYMLGILPTEPKSQS